MSNKQDSELNGVKIFGDLNADVPVESFQTTNTKNPVFSIVNYTLMEGLTKAGQVSYYNDTFGYSGITSDLSFQLANFATGLQNSLLLQDAFTSDNIITTKLGMYLDSGDPSDNNNKPSKTLFKYDAFRQSIGSIWCLSTREYDKESNSYIDIKKVERLKNAYIGDAFLYSSTDGIQYNVLNPYSAPAGTPIQDFAPYTQAPANYSAHHKINSIGISQPILQDAQDVNPITAGSDDSKEKEEIIYIEFEESDNFESSVFVDADFTPIKDKMKLLSLFFTVDQKISGYTITPSIKQFLNNLNKLNFIWGQSNASEVNFGVPYDAVVDYEEVAQSSFIPPEPVTFLEMLAPPDPYTPVDVGQFTDTAATQIVKEVIGNLEGKKYEDITFNYSRAINKEYAYLYGEEIASKPTANITPFYNYISPAYETVATKTAIDELALPNIYKVAEDESYDFEAFGSKILNCANAEVTQINNSAETKKYNNVIIPAIGYFSDGYQISELQATLIEQTNNQLPDHIEPLPLDLVNKVEQSKDDFPFGVQIDFSGDDFLYETPDNNSLCILKADKKPVHNSGDLSEGISNFTGQEFLKKMFASGIVLDFIKTLIYSHFAGDNLSNPPNMDPEKFALLASSPEFPNGAQIAKGIMDPPLRYVNEILEPSSVDLLPDSEQVYTNSEAKTEYDFMKWLETYHVDGPGSSSPNENSILYKNNGDIQKVTKAFGNESFVDVFNSFMSDNVSTANYASFMLRIHDLLYEPPTDVADHLLYRSFKECVSKMSYKKQAEGAPSNQFSMQQTLFYRIAKYKQGGFGANNELIQNIFIPAHGISMPDNSKVPDPNYRYIDTQVRYGEAYTYEISCYKMVIGTEYEYDFAPYNTNPGASSNSKYDSERNTRINNLASSLKYGDQTSEFYKNGDYITPIYKLTTTEDSSDEEKNKRLMMFAVRSRPSVKIIEVPYFREQFVAVMDKPPISPLVNLYPLAGKKNDLLISFENQTGDIQQIPIAIYPSDNQYFALERLQQHRAIRGDDGFLINPSLHYRSDDFPSAYEVFRLEGVKPSSYSDFKNAEYKKLKITEETSFIDKIDTNTKYYYVFRTVDLHGNISNPTPLYEVEMVEDSGAVYPLIRVVDFASDVPYTYSKNFRRYLKIDVSSLQSMLNEELSQIDGTTAYVPDVPPVLGQSSYGGTIGTVWNKNRPYKFRVRSKKTGRVFDLNVKFKVRHTDSIEPPTDCNDNVEPGGIIVKDVKDYLGAEGDGDL